jgi:hypothetical protein
VYHVTNVTPLLLVWKRFSDGLLGLLEGKPCPQDVAGGVHVGVGVVTAAQAAELCLGDAVTCRCVPALGAPLRGVTGIHRYHCPPGTFSLGGEDSQEDSPSRVEDGLIQTRFTRRPVGLMAAGAVRTRLWPPRHIGDLEFLVDDKVVALY